MSYIRVKQKYQVTIPTNVREAIGIHEGDTLEARTENGNIVLIPQLIHERKPAKKQGIDISRYIGSMKDFYGSNTQEIDDYIRNERDSWD
jgi:AbrB family looped-hinge helix DNA binding protein